MANNIDEDGASGSAAPAATASPTNPSTDAAVSLVPRSQTKSPNKKKKRPGFRPRAKPTPSKANKAGSSNNKAVKSNTKQPSNGSTVGLKAASLEQDQDATIEGDKEGGLKEPSTAAAIDGTKTPATTTRAATSSNEQNVGGSKEKQLSRPIGMNSSSIAPILKPTGLKNVPPNSSLATTEMAALQAATTTAAAAAIGTTLRRRGRSNSISSTATASSRKRLPSSIRVGVTRTTNMSTRNTVRFEGLPLLLQQQQQQRQQNEGATLASHNRNEDDTQGTLGETAGSGNAVGTITTTATDATSLVTTRTMTDMTPPSNTALVAAAAAATAAGDRAVLHDQELMEKLAAETTDQPQLGSFCRTMKKSKRKNEKDDDAAAATDGTGAKKGKRRKKRKNGGNETTKVEGTSVTAVTASTGEGTVIAATAPLAAAAAPSAGNSSEGAVDVAKDTAEEELKDTEPDGPAVEGSAAAALVGVPVVQIVDGEIVLQESSLVLPTRRTIREVEEEFQDNIVEEDAQPAIVNASYSSFRTKRGGNGANSSGKRGPHQWSVEETQKFYSALRMLGTDFGSMEALFDNKRTRRQLKYKYRTELARNPSLVEDLALNPKFKSEIDISFFNVEVDPERIKALENEEPPAYEPTDVVIVTDENEQAGGNTSTDHATTAEAAEEGNNGTATNGEIVVDAVENETRLAEGRDVDNKQNQLPVGNVEERGGEVLEVVEEDAEEERLAAVAAAISTELPLQETRKKARSKAMLKSRAPSTPTKRSTKSTKNEGVKPHRPADDQLQGPSRKNSFQEAQDELADLEEDNACSLLEEDFDMPMGDEEESMRDEEEPSAAPIQPGSGAGKAAAVSSAKTPTAAKKREPKQSPRKKRSEKVSVVGKKSTGAKVKRPKIRPSPGKKKKT